MVWVMVVGMVSLKGDCHVVACIGYGKHAADTSVHGIQFVFLNQLPFGI
jgi:hypothetical protein